MEKFESINRLFIFLGGFTASALFGDFDYLIKCLLGLMAFDYLTGFAASAITGNLSSTKGFKGLLKKFVIIMVICSGHIADLMLQTEGNYVRDAFIYAYGALELISIAENAGRAGLPVPAFMKRVIALFQEKENLEKVEK
ncbi:holin family protein [Aneurinibacillus aneurinilyticus]|uniref:phage holin family protein n=2 Tax=Aneurinibacillus aneurinilyticus TaxID=1391 RepID=UPI0035269A7D